MSSVSENGVVGYMLESMSPDCPGTIALGEHQTCVVVNDDGWTRQSRR